MLAGIMNMELSKLRLIGKSGTLVHGKPVKMVHFEISASNLIEKSLKLRNSNLGQISPSGHFGREFWANLAQLAITKVKIVLYEFPI